MQNKIVYIEWTDSVSVGGNVWTSMESIDNIQLHTCYSVGFLLKEDDKSITIAGHMGGTQVSGDLTIPKVSITKRKFLRK